MLVVVAAEGENVEWQSWLGSGADVIGILGAIFALAAWWQARRIRAELADERQRLTRRVTVVLQHGDQRIELPVELTRAELTRAEILGRIGMIPMKARGQRFSLTYLNTPEFLRQINQVAAGAGDDLLTIPCTAAEIAQFELAPSSAPRAASRYGGVT